MALSLFLKNLMFHSMMQSSISIKGIILSTKLVCVTIDLAQKHQYPPEDIRALELTEEQTHDLTTMESHLKEMIKEMKRKYDSLFKIYPNARQQ